MGQHSGFYRTIRQPASTPRAEAKSSRVVMGVDQRQKRVGMIRQVCLELMYR